MLVFVQRSQATTIDPTTAEFETTAGKKVFMDISRIPTLIVSRSKKNREVFEYRNKKKGIAVVGETSHCTSMCSCANLCLLNNMETKLYLYVCVPREIEKYQETEDTVGDRVDSLSNATGRLLNHSLVFSGDISRMNTCLPRLLRRPSLAQVVRTEPKFFKAWGSEVDYRAKPDLLRPIFLQMRRGESDAFLAKLEEDNGKPADDKNQWNRFWPIEFQKKSPDVMLAGKGISVDDILNNSIYISPFTGPHVCGFCGLTVQGTGIESLLEHFATRHRKLRDSYFSCPACINVVIVSWESYSRHFAKTHEASTALLIVLNQIQTHVRTSWGIALLAFIKVINILDLSLDLGEEPDQVITAYGGYTPIGDGQVKVLIKEVKKRQDHFLPGFLRAPRDTELGGLSTPGMMSRANSPPRAGIRRMVQRPPTPQPSGSSQPHTNPLHMELENVDISTELTRCINSIRSPTEGIEHEGEIYGVLGGQRT
jgi:hypothetical protein